MRDRPVGVTILAVFAIIVGVANILLAVVAMGLVAFALPGFVGAVGEVGSGALVVSGIAMLILGIAEVVFGIGAIGLRSWAWVLGVVGFGLNLILALIQMFTVGFTSAVVISALISVAVLLYLYSRNVRVAFGHDDGSLFHTSTHGPVPIT